MPVIGRTQAEAEEKFQQINRLIHPEHGVSVLSDMVALDLRPFPLDGPLPPVPLTNSQQGRQKVVVDMARRENLTIRQLYQRVAWVLITIPHASPRKRTGGGGARWVRNATAMPKNC